MRMSAYSLLAAGLWPGALAAADAPAPDFKFLWVNDLHLDAADVKSPIVATEFVGTSVSTTGDGTDITDAQRAMVAENPWVRFCNNQRGYVTCDVRKEQMTTQYRVVDFVTRAGAPVKTRASFVVESGRPGAHSA